METERRLSASRTYVPDRYRVILNPVDLGHFEGYRGTLESDLAESILVHARQRGYTLLARPRVRLEASEGVKAGDITVASELLDPQRLREAASGLRRVDGRGDNGSPANAPPAARGPEPSPRPPLPDVTAAYHAPRPVAPSAIIEIAGPGMPPHRVAFRGGTLRVGRAPDSDIVLSDERVSRRHGAFTTRQGALIYSDQGSTNGSFVNGAAVTELALGTGDVVRLGNTTLTIQPDR